MLRHSKTLTWCACAAALTGSGIGCDDEHSVQSYQTPKEEVRPAVAFGAPGGTATPTAAATQGPAIHWTLPPGWTEQPPQNMESARFAVSAATPQTALTVVSLGGVAGGMLMNVQRWEGQLKLPPSTEADLPQRLTRIDVAGMPVDVVDLSQPAAAPGGPPAQRILAAVLPREDRTWFFKLMGPADVVAAQKPAFDAFVRSIHFESAAAPDAGGATQPAAVAQAPAATPAPTGTGAMKAWKTPQGWTEVANGAPFRVLSFNVGAAGAEAVVSKLPADRMGTLLANVNRWRGQVGLAPLADEKQAETQTVPVGGRQGMLFDFVGPPANDPNAKRLLLVMARVGEENWFFKLTGPAGVVGAQRSAFEEFLNSIQFGGEAGE